MIQAVYKVISAHGDKFREGKEWVGRVGGTSLRPVSGRAGALSLRSEIPEPHYSNIGSVKETAWGWRMELVQYITESGATVQFAAVPPSQPAPQPDAASGLTPVTGVAKAALANPKQAFGDKKPPIHLIHTIAELHESAALHSGGRKYGFNNYIATPVEAMTYVGAIKRHLGQWASGERVDAKELVHHLGAIKACCTILLTAEATGMLIDNRPKVGGGPATCAATPATNVLASATAQTFKEVEGVIEHLNKLYPAKL